MSSASKRILVADDKKGDRRKCRDFLESKGYHVAEVSDVPALLKVLKRHDDLDVVLLDMRLPLETEGLDALHMVRELSPDTDVVMMSAYGDIPKAVQAMRLGAYSFVEKDRLFLEQMDVTLRRLFESRGLKHDRELLIKTLWSNIQKNVYPSSHEKGEALEQLLACLVKSLPGLEVIAVDYVTKTEEIDVVVRNCLADAFWINQGAIFLFECKNWVEKVGKRELADFQDKLGTRFGRCRLGFFISPSGFTSKLRDHLLRNSRSNALLTLLGPTELTSLVHASDRLQRLRKVIEKSLLA
jgi:CheY-like chemotaxis protein